jgi:hypothetical protein
MSCARQAIRAHSVQNATALELLAVDGHVIAPTLRLGPEARPDIQLRSVGRNRATTFAGLCSEHDRQLFAPIETSPIDPTIDEHLFLLAYRATFFEAHATVAAMILIQASYQERTRLGFDPKDEMSPAGLFAVERMMIAYETNMYKAAYDEAYLTRQFDRIVHDVIQLEVAEPTLAVSALIALEEVSASDTAIRVCVTVIPVSEHKTLAVWSYLREDAETARMALDRVLGASGEHQKYEISRRVLNHSSNFVLSPRFVHSWSREKRHTVVDLFKRTIFTNDLEFEHPDLLLFR